MSVQTLWRILFSKSDFSRKTQLKALYILILAVNQIEVIIEHSELTIRALCIRIYINTTPCIVFQHTH